jgi:hypothetical protein
MVLVWVISNACWDWSCLVRIWFASLNLGDGAAALANLGSSAYKVIAKLNGSYINVRLAFVLLVFLLSVLFIPGLCRPLISNFEKWTVGIAMEENNRSSTGGCIWLRRRRNVVRMRSTVVVHSDVASALLGIKGPPRERTNWQKRMV